MVCGLAVGCRGPCLGAGRPCVAWTDAFAGKPAPTGLRPARISVGAGLPAKRPVSHAAPGPTPSLAS
ncbi:hypothetical protein F6S12_28675 [Pseudomonas sp. JV245A]|nr:hypothetical protein [Pseudomonas sp. JV245A]